METTSIYPQGQILPKDWFQGNGDAFLNPLVSRDKNNEFSAGSVTFEPGVRTNWHTHPKGQVLLITEGNGFYQERGKPAQPLTKGSVVNIPEDVEHWHGASPDSTFVHIAITNYKDEVQVTWLQRVSNEEYNQATNS